MRNERKSYVFNLSDVKYPCKHCGRKAVIPYWVTRQMCTWCGHWVYKNDLDEFKDKLKVALLKAKKEGMIKNVR